MWFQYSLYFAGMGLVGFALLSLLTLLYAAKRVVPRFRRTGNFFYGFYCALCVLTAVSVYASYYNAEKAYFQDPEFAQKLTGFVQTQILPLKTPETK